MEHASRGATISRRKKKDRHDFVQVCSRSRSRRTPHALRAALFVPPCQQQAAAACSWISSRFMCPRPTLIGWESRDQRKVTGVKLAVVGGTCFPFGVVLATCFTSRGFRFEQVDEQKKIKKLKGSFCLTTPFWCSYTECVCLDCICFYFERTSGSAL